MIQDRWQRLTDMLKDCSIEAIAVNPGPTLYFLTGLHLHLSERPTLLIFTPGKDPHIILPALELNKISAASVPLVPITYSDDPLEWNTVFSNVAHNLGLENKSIGVETIHLRLLELNYLQTATSHAQIVSADTIFNNLRLKKDSSEIHAIRKAVEIAQAAMDLTIPMIKPGTTEREIASRLFMNLLKAGSDVELPFSPIVASGPNSANPHAVPSDRKLNENDLLVIDWGARFNGYASDLTRTFGIGSLEPELVTIYQVVLEANLAGIKEGHPGISVSKVDGAARSVIERSGYGQFFTHRTGHGIGLECHEEPYIYRENTMILTEGMVYTVEPGIYIPGKGGVRIEDDVLITNKGFESLSNYPKELRVLP